MLIHTRILIKGFKPISIHKDDMANTYMVNGILCQDISRESRYLCRDDTLVLKLTHTQLFPNPQICCTPNEYSTDAMFLGTFGHI